MIGSNQKKLVLALVENTPTLVFLGLLQATDELRLAGWAAAAAAAVLFAAFAHYRIAHHPILLAINLYILLITPLIEAGLVLGFKAQARFVIDHTQVGVLLAVFAVGAWLTAFAKNGFIGVDCGPSSLTRRLSVYLLLASAAAVAWSLAFEGNRVLAIAVPLAALFGLRQFLVAGLRDRGIDTDALGAAAIAAPAAAVATTGDGADTLL